MERPAFIFNRQFQKIEPPAIFGTRYNTRMFRFVSALVLGLCLTGWAGAQVDQLPSSGSGPGKNQAPPRSDSDKEGESSSRDTKIDLTPPKDDAKNHPYSGAALSDAEAEANPEVQEFHPWDPHKAAKNIEVGDFYFKRKNYRAALARYQEALTWKPEDAMANLHLGQCFEKLDEPEQATAHYQEYLRILPHGPLSEEVRKAISRLQAAAQKSETSEKSPPK
jgi:tetratricopeptide (TPR) repeat protein